MTQIFIFLRNFITSFMFIAILFIAVINLLLFTTTFFPERWNSVFISLLLGVLLSLLLLSCYLANAID